MDPINCLLSAEDALIQGDLDTCHDTLRDYAAWRIRGGFEPGGIIGRTVYGDGDSVYNALKRAMAEF